MNTGDSKYIEKKDYLSRYTPPEAVVRAGSAGVLRGTGAEKRNAMEGLEEDLPRFIPFLRASCNLDFRGRILEIGAGGAWLSAELSKLPKVVEIITTDISPKLLKEEAPAVFERLQAQATKITRTPADFHRLQFPDDCFDYVVCSGVLQESANIVQVLREAKRVLKPGGKFVAVREPVWPLVKFRSRSKPVEPAKARGQGYTLVHYKELFKQAALPLEVKRVNTASGFRYLLNSVVNGFTHARYAFIGTKRGRSAVPPRKPVPAGRAPKPRRVDNSRK